MYYIFSANFLHKFFKNIWKIKWLIKVMKKTQGKGTLSNVFTDLVASHLWV